LTGERLARELTALTSDEAQRATLAANARALATPDAARLIADVVLALAGGSTTVRSTGRR
jgi:UDP-N-acetylglucosamine:LPS N-acetylglucosamine transferase